MPQESRYSLQMDHSSLVDYGYGAPSPKAAYRNSDIDFRDVFGGPPLRASVHDVRYSFTEGMESSAVSDRSSGEASLRDPWTGAEEKPVFGGEESVNRQHLREDFFDDIFKGGESPSSTPRNVFSSSPGSRVMSPARPLPPRDDGFGSPSAPSQLSLPDKLSKGIELPTFGSTTTAHESPKDDTAPNRGSPLHSPKMSVFGFSTRVQEDSRNSHYPSYRPSPLSQQFSLGSQELFEPTKSAEKSEDLKKDSEEVTQFHFSIYKWADKGIPIPLVMPLRRTNSAKLKERRKTEVSSFTEVPETLSPAPEPVPVTLQSVIDSGFSVSDPDSVFYGMEGSESNSGSKDADVAVHDVPRNGRGMEASEIKGMKLDQVLKEEVREELKSDSKVGSGDEIKRRILDQVLKEEVREEPKRNSKTELKPLRSFFHDEQNKPGNAAEYATNEKNRERQRNKKVPKKDDVKKDEVFKKQQNATELPVPKKEDVKKVTPPQKTVAPESTTKRRGKNKVKDFIRIFNQEPTPSKSKTTPNSPPSRSSRWKETPATVEAAATQQENSQRSAVDERIINMSYVEEVPKKEPDASSDTIGSIHRPLQKEDSITNTAKPPPSHPSSDPTQRNTSSSRNETVTEDARETVEEADDSSQTSFTIKELSAEDESKQEQSTEDKDEIQAMDAKIRQWSRGKEGNIRSLLSTLQYVLWPGSGWKPVPLVNIIEGPGVKRAYQKAMLCLHPDKLQQKGASSHHKYLAEKVFDILQEAWDHFNTLGGL